ncbi:MAG: HAMP domain-containing histidine kinase [Ruminococcus sp.]|nr:HAMP domain-containing histidine kinase [Ruminococcus sp.]
MSLRAKIWEYFIFFTAMVLVILWFLQIVFIDNFYKGMKIKDVKNVAVEIAENYGNDDYSLMLTQLAISNDICIDVADKYGRILYTKDTLGKSCLIHGPQASTGNFLYKLKNSGETELYYTEFNQLTNSDMLIYMTIIGSEKSPDGYILINSPLVPVDATAAIFKKQLLLVTVFLLLLSLIISYFMAKKISEPIARITKSAEQMAAGNYDIKFDGKGYAEIQRLSNTLTFAGMQISKVDAMQRDLIANVSHDLRTPLTMLKAYAEMIRDLSGDNPEKRNEHLEIIINETDRLALLVSDMLDLSKLERGDLKLNYSEFNIKELLEDIISRYKGLSDKQEYDISFEADSDITVNCDIIKIQQVIYNLINNAVNYTGEDKKIFVKQINKPDCVRIEVSDTGEGIEPDKIKLIFEKYYRSENHKREVVGTGLGLSIVKAILKKHGYNFGVFSSVGKGSTFWFEIKDIAGKIPQQAPEKPQKKNLFKKSEMSNYNEKS